jgi:hypothetical protein
MNLFKNPEPEELSAFYHWLPELIHKNSIVSIEIDDYECPDIRDKAIIFQGNIEGFLSLRDIINYCAIEFIYAKLDLSVLPFVNINMGKKFLIEFTDDHDLQSELAFDITSDTGVALENSDSIIWKISWSQSAQIIQSIHGFLYHSWNHLHFDPKNDLSKYAVVFYLNDA